MRNLSYLVTFKDKFEISITCPGTKINSDRVYLDLVTEGYMQNWLS